MTITVPTGQNFAYFDVIGQDTAVSDVRIDDPAGIVRDAAGNTYVSQYSSRYIRKIDAVTGLVSTFAGTGTNADTGDGGPAVAAAIAGPVGSPSTTTNSTSPFSIPVRSGRSTWPPAISAPCCRVRFQIHTTSRSTTTETSSLRRMAAIVSISTMAL